MKPSNYYIIVAPDGRQVTAQLPPELAQQHLFAAPDWLVCQLDYRPSAAHQWWLSPSGSAPGRLWAVRATRAAAAVSFDPRQERLKREWIRLQQLNSESDNVKVQPLDDAAGCEPELYRVTLRCRGIIGIHPDKRPIYGDEHVVIVQCDESFPAEPPRLRWETAIWHPNVQHADPKGVCINKPEWLGGMDVYDLCRFLFDMAQYRNYHAENVYPYPLDQEVAKWVREYAEPNGIVNKKAKKYVDDRPFIRPSVVAPARISMIRPEPARSVIRVIKSGPAGATPPAPATPAPPKPSRIKLIK